MKPAYLVDSAILIDNLNGVPEATRWLTSLKEGEAAISVITRAEVLSGGDAHAMSAAMMLCDQFACLDITQAVADKTADLRRRHRWKLPDAFQAALAIHHKVRLVTRNTKDFSERSHPFVLVPYRL